MMKKMIIGKPVNKDISNRLWKPIYRKNYFLVFWAVSEDILEKLTRLTDIGVRL